MNSPLLGRVPDTTLPRIVDSRKHELIDHTGRRYVDAISGAYAAILGYSPDSARQAMFAAASRVPYVHNARFDTNESLELAATLSRLSGPEGYSVYFSVSGADGVEAALRIATAYRVARGAKAQHEMACMGYSYHGSTGFALSATGHAAARGVYEPNLKQVRRVDLLSWTYGPKSPQPAWISDPASIEETLGAQTGAILFEPMLGNAAGCVEMPDATLASIQSVCKANDIVTIADEISVGSWRCDGLSLARSKGMSPDLIVLGKALTAGLFPLSAVLVAPHIVAALGGSVNLLGHTHAAHPVGCAVALNVVRQVSAPAFQEQMAAMKSRIALHVRSLGELPVIAAVRGRGAMYSICLAFQDRRDARGARSGRLYDACLSRGVLVMPGSSVNERGELVSDHVTLAPAFNTPDSTLDQIFGRLGEAVLAL
ncbi:putative aminotransferase (plasmid) [Burkholderia sp. AD24]|nr:putative aminotransferase [Burkholderia sp. AD24]